MRRDGRGALLYGSEERSSRLLHVVDSSFVRFHEARRAGLAELVLDGKGIAPSTAKGFGLTAMTERVRSLGGSCVIESARSRGTTTHIDIPMKAEKEKKARDPELAGAL